MIDLLRQHGVEPSAEDLADIYWLALHMGLLAAVSEPQDELPPEDPLLSEPLPPEMLSQLELPPPVAVPPVSSSPAPAPKPAPASHVPVHGYEPGSAGSTRGNGDRLPIALPSASALPDQLDLARALRPLMRRVRSRQRQMLDEQASAQQIAESRTWVPVLRPRPERWLDVALVVDRAPSMLLWRQMLEEWRRLLERQGAFRDVRPWSLDASSPGGVRLFAGWNEPAGSERSPDELSDPGQRRLILLCSDTVAPAWQSEAVQRLIHTWGQHNHVALIQPLPQRLWRHSPLGRYEPWSLRTTAVGTSNALLSAAVRLPDDESLDEPAAQLLAPLLLPVLHLNRSSLSGWATLLTGGDAQVGGVLLQLAAQAPVAEPDEPDEQADDPVERVRGFQLFASKPAWRLARALSAVPLSLPLMRLAQQLTSPSPRPEHLAEVVLGGLFRRIQGVSEQTAPDAVQFEFYPGVREELGRHLPTPDRQTLQRQISAHVVDRAGRPFSFRGLLLDPQAADYQQLAERNPAFADPPVGVIDGISYDDLAQAGWALVVSSQEDARLLGALAPLIQRRCAQQGLQAPDLEIRAGETCGPWLARQTPNADRPMDAALGDRRVPVLLYDHGESCGAWLGRHGLFAQAVDPRRGVPFYLLLAGLPGPAHPGDQRAIPFTFQYDLDLFWGVGRLCFHDEAGQHRLADYRAYAERLVAYEQGSATPTARQVAWFGPRNPLDEATDQSATELIPPLAHGQAGQPGVAARYGFGQTALLGRQATRAALLEQLGRRPALLFSATHGLGFPADDPRQMSQQGALVCADWDGLGAVRREHVLAADDIGPHLDVRGLVHVCFACYGAGCPEEESFVYQPGAPARRIAPRALIGQLPQRLLAQGALAVLGHVDKVWSYSFRARGEASPGAPAPLLTAQVQGFEDLVGRILSGKRMGHVTDQFNSHQGALAVDLLERQRRYGRVRADYPDLGLDELAKVWKMFQNARCYLLLGDPAARLLPGLLAIPGSGW